MIGMAFHIFTYENSTMTHEYWYSDFVRKAVGSIFSEIMHSKCSSMLNFTVDRTQLERLRWVEVGLWGGGGHENVSPVCYMYLIVLNLC